MLYDTVVSQISLSRSLSVYWPKTRPQTHADKLCVCIVCLGSYRQTVTDLADSQFLRALKGSAKFLSLQLCVCVFVRENIRFRWLHNYSNSLCDW